MITITQNSNGFDIHGHAGYAPEGQDIVCAGVTALFQTLIESMEKLTTDRIQTNIQPGNVSVSYGNLSEAEKLAQMTREEKAEYRARQLEKELNDLKRQNAVSDMAKTARKMLADEEINLPDEVIFNLVSEDAELTKTAVEAFAKTFKEAVQAAVKDALRGTTPKAAGKPSEITKEQILNVKDTNERRRLMAENPELFIRR